MFFLSFPERTNLSDLHKSICKCDWATCFKQDIFQQILQRDASSTERSDLLSAAIAALLAFIQQNFVGPSASYEMFGDFSEKSNIRNLMKSDGEDLNVNIRSPELLYVCKLIFDQLISTEKENVPSFAERIWFLRYLIVYQRCLDDLTHSIYSTFDKNVASFAKALNEIDNQPLKIQTHVEILQGYILFKRITKSERWMTAVHNLMGIEITVEGVLGIRTKYQKNPLPQLTMRVKGVEQLELPLSEHTHGHIQLPTILKLEDDLRLEKVEFISEQENTDAQLPSLIQAVVLSKL